MSNQLSIIAAIEDALNAFIQSYDEYPDMVLVGPPELSGLIREMVAKDYDVMPSDTNFQVSDMIVVPKLTPGIDFQVSVKLSQTLNPEHRRKFIAEHGN